MPQLIVSSRSPDPSPSDRRGAPSNGFSRAFAVTLLLAGMAFASTAAGQSGGGFDLSWSSIGSGTRTAGGAFALDGVVSPTLAGHATGGAFTLDGGWGAVTSTIGVPPPPVALPTQFALLPPQPNPSAHDVAIAFDVPRATQVQLSVYDLRGRRVGLLADGSLPPGHHALTWSGTAPDGGRLPSGIYFMRLDAAEFHTTSRLVLIH